jgi:hypothetical protein
MTYPLCVLRVACLAIVSSLLISCAGHSLDTATADAPRERSDENFSHGAFPGPRPWSHERFDDAPGKFTFAIFSDLTGGERDGIFSVAAEQLRLLRPEFIINVGDMIEGATEDRTQLNTEWASFDRRAERLIPPFFHVGGNHDLTNPVQWEIWEQRLGQRYYHFLYRDVLFLVLDTEDTTAERQTEIFEARSRALARVAVDGWGIYGETEYARMQEAHTGTVSPEQSEYFRQVIADHPEVRWTFLFMHKPAWMKEGEENFLAIEDALSDRDYTVFNGHNHTYVYRPRRGRDYIQLATTGGVQLAGKTKAVDHLTLVTVSDSGVDIANLEMAGIFDKTGHLPLNGDELCFEAAVCGDPPE